MLKMAGGKNMKKFLPCMLALLALPIILSADTFINGGFETGDFSGWTQGSGLWKTPFSPGSPTDYLPGGARYNAAGYKSAIVGVGSDPITGKSMVYNGNYAARINDSSPNYHVSVASQTVNNYTDSHIFFEWSAVLQASHGIGDSDYFGLKLTDDTAGQTLYAVSFDSASTPGYFTQTGDWFYSDWQIQDLDVSSRLGHSFTLTVLGSDCPYGGHGGYVYVDGFAPTIVEQGTVPEPGTIVLLGTATLLLAVKFRKRSSLA
jgi:hypothetical protein